MTFLSFLTIFTLRSFRSSDAKITLRHEGKNSIGNYFFMEDLTEKP